MNNDDDRIRDLLGSAAPDRPDLPPTARTLAVTRRAHAVRRRRRVALAAAAIAVVGIGVGVPVLTSGGDDRGQVAGDPAPSSPVEVVAPECPAEPPVVDDGPPAADFPDGAASLRLCPATSSVVTGPIELTLPTEPVTDDVDALLDEIAALPAYVFPPECAATTPVLMPWAMVVSYPDGTSVSVGTSTTSCSSVTVDGQEVESAQALGLVADAITGQEFVGVPMVGPPLTCPAPDEIDAARNAADEIAGTLDDFAPVFALVCYVPDPMGVREYADDEGALVGDDLAVVVDDLRAGTTPEATVAGRCTDSGPTRVLVLAEAQGDRITRVDASCTTEFAGGGTYWLAGPEAEAVLDEALGGRTQ